MVALIFGHFIAAGFLVLWHLGYIYRLLKLEMLLLTFLHIHLIVPCYVNVCILLTCLRLPNMSTLMYPTSSDWL